MTGNFSRNLNKISRLISRENKNFTIFHVIIKQSNPLNFFTSIIMSETQFSAK